MIVGKDGVTRAADLKTARGILSRPVQRLHVLEVPDDEVLHESHVDVGESSFDVEEFHVDADNRLDSSDSGYVTRGGRKVKFPSRLLD